MSTFREFDSVELLVPVGDPDGPAFPVGTRAAIVDLDSGHAFVEIVEEDGRVYGPFGVARADMRLVEHAHAG